MFFFIGGVQQKTVLLEEHPSTCPFCSGSKVQKKRLDHYVSIFFIPLFRIKRGIPFLACGNCQSIINRGEDTVDTGSGFEDTEKLKRCVSCQQTLDKEFSYCPYCGKPL